jgi:hypothetical protein
MNANVARARAGMELVSASIAAKLCFERGEYLRVRRHLDELVDAACSIEAGIAAAEARRVAEAKASAERAARSTARERAARSVRERANRAAARRRVGQS